MLVLSCKKETCLLLNKFSFAYSLQLPYHGRVRYSDWSVGQLLWCVSFMVPGTCTVNSSLLVLC